MTILKIFLIIFCIVEIFAAIFIVAIFYVNKLKPTPKFRPITPRFPVFSIARIILEVKEEEVNTHPIEESVTFDRLNLNGPN
jgi:Na+/H+ antiporter NhaA